MPVINYKGLKNHIKESADNGFAPVYLIYGEEFLYKTAFDKLLDAMLPDSAKSLNYEPVVGADEDIYQVISKLNTFSFLSGIKVVAVQDSRIFYTKQDVEAILEKAKDAYDDKDIKKAAKYIQKLTSLLNLDFDDIRGERRQKSLNQEIKTPDEDMWLDAVIDYCIDKNLSPSESKDNCMVLQKAVEKGFPERNHLIITVGYVDKRRGLYKAIKKNGIVIDCSVLTGGRKEDKIAQKAVLYETCAGVLKKRDKKIDKRAYDAVFEMIGFNPRTFANSIEKLVNYVGNREKITVEDVENVLKRTKKDPIYEFTDAITDKDTDRALFYLDSLLTGGDVNHPLQLLAAIANQVRKLLIIKDFVIGAGKDKWHAGYQYDRFQDVTMPGIIEYDKTFVDLQKKWDEMLQSDSDAARSGGVSEFLIAKNPKNTFPVYKMLKKSEKFSKKELFNAFELIYEADLLFKTAGQKYRLILEKLVFNICRGAI